MKAARIHQHGSPEVLIYEDVPDPKIKANQFLVFGLVADEAH